MFPTLYNFNVQTRPPIYNYPGVGATLMPTSTLYNFASDLYGSIAKNSSPLYSQPLSQTLGIYNNPYNTPFDTNPLSILSGTSYYYGQQPSFPTIQQQPAPQQTAPKPTAPKPTTTSPMQNFASLLSGNDEFWNTLKGIVSGFSAMTQA